MRRKTSLARTEEALFSFSSKIYSTSIKYCVSDLALRGCVFFSRKKKHYAFPAVAGWQPAGSIEERLLHAGARSHHHRQWRDRTAGWRCWAHPSPGSWAHRPLLYTKPAAGLSTLSAEARENRSSRSPTDPADPAAGRRPSPRRCLSVRPPPLPALASVRRLVSLH